MQRSKSRNACRADGVHDLATILAKKFRLRTAPPMTSGAAAHARSLVAGAPSHSALMATQVHERRLCHVVQDDAR